MYLHTYMYKKKRWKKTFYIATNKQLLWSLFFEIFWIYYGSLS